MPEIGFPVLAAGRRVEDGDRRVQLAADSQRLAVGCEGDGKRVLGGDPRLARCRPPARSQMMTSPSGMPKASSVPSGEKQG